MAVYFVFTLVGLMDASLFDARERPDLRQWPIALLFVAGHFLLLAMLVVSIRHIRRHRESWVGDRAIRGVYIPWLFYLIGIGAKVWYFH